MTAKRKVVVQPPLTSGDPGIKEIPGLLEAGWHFDPYLNPSGRPIFYTGDRCYWVLVQGDFRAIPAMDPFVNLPMDEEPVEADPGFVGQRTERIPFDKKTGEPLREPKPGYVVLHKDHISTTGTVYTLPPGPEEAEDPCLVCEREDTPEACMTCENASEELLKSLKKNGVLKEE